MSSVDVAGTTFSVSFWLECGWSDPRIAWDTHLWSRSLHIPKEDVWQPDIYIANTQSTAQETRIFEPKVIVNPNGNVKLMVHFNSMLNCDMNPTMFPHDNHTCDVAVGVFADPMAQQLTINLVEFGYTLGTAASGWIVTIPELATSDGPSAAGTKVWDNIAKFHLHFERNPGRYSWNYVIPALLLQLIGFSQFWFHVGSSSNVDRGGVATVALLSIMALQSSVDSFDTANLSWMDMFFFLNIVFLFLSFVITMTSAYSEPQEFEEGFEERKRKKKRRFSGITVVKSEPSWHTSLVRTMWTADNWHDQFGKRYLIPVYLVIIWLHSWNVWQTLLYGTEVASISVINTPLFIIVAVLLVAYVYVAVAQWVMRLATDAAAVTVDTAVDTTAADAVASVEGRVLSAEDIAVEAEMNAILASAPSTSFSNESNESSPNNLSSAGVVSAVRTSRPKKSNKVVPATEVQAALPRVAVEAAVLEAAVVPEVPVEQPKVAELDLEVIRVV